ncbi:MAG: hypothetical protein ACRDCX_13060, partial [Aeromonas sp.]
YGRPRGMSRSLPHHRSITDRLPTNHRSTTDQLLTSTHYGGAGCGRIGADFLLTTDALSTRAI